MAKKIAELLIKLGADTYGFKAMSGEVKKQLAGLSKDLQGFGKSMSLYFTAPLTAAAGASVHLADVQMQAEQRLLTALKGRESVQKRLIKQAGELQSRSIFGDEVIIGQQAFLASLGLTEQQINDTIEASAQLSAATGMTLDSAVKNLAKTYGGLTGELGESIPALKQFTAEELKNGAAVQFALDNYKGFAKTVARTGLGPLQQLKNSLGDLGEEIGMVLMPVVREIVGWFQKAVTWLQELPSGTKTAIVAVGGLVAAIGPLSMGLGAVLKMLPLLKAGFAAMLGPVGLVATAIAAVTTAIIGFNAAKKQAFSDAADQLVEKWREGDYTPEQLADLQSRKQARVSALKTRIYYDQKDNSYDPNKSKRIRESKEEIAQLEVEIEAIRRLIDIKKQNTAASENDGTEKTIGLIGQLQNKITKLEKAKREATTIREISRLNQEIEKTNKELERVQNVGLKDDNGLLKPLIEKLEALKDRLSKTFDPNKVRYLNREIAVLEKKISDMTTVSNQSVVSNPWVALKFSDKDLTETKNNINQLQQLAEKYTDNPAYKDQYDKARSKYSLMQFGRVTPLQFDPNAINPPAADWEAAAEKFRQNLGNMKNTVQGAIMDYGAMLNNLVQDLAFAFGEGLGNILSGDGAFDDLAAGFGRAVGQFLVSLGKQLIATSEVIESIKVALNSIWATPWVGLVVGAAAIAAGTAMISAFKSNASKGIALANGGLAYGPTMALVGDNRGAGSDPEVIAPLSKLRQYGFGRQSLEFVGGQFRVSGSDLLLAIRREDVRVNYVNAGV